MNLWIQLIFCMLVLMQWFLGRLVANPTLHHWLINARGLQHLYLFLLEFCITHHSRGVEFKAAQPQVFLSTHHHQRDLFENTQIGLSTLSFKIIYFVLGNIQSFHAVLLLLLLLWLLLSSSDDDWYYQIYCWYYQKLLLVL